MVSVLKFGIFSLLLLQNVNFLSSKRYIETNAGLIEGVKADDGTYYMYLGIPYAEIKDTLFGPSVPYPLFKEPYTATKDSAMCPQTNKKNGTVVGKLDCLRLNVYVPVLDDEIPDIPVMIWFYGGIFQYGYAGKERFGPKYLISHDVILVTVNYRVGPYGFMCLDIPAVPGNQGLRDQYLAIKWVKDNIDGFGGNPNLITLFGQDAGAYSIQLHLLSKKEVLFNKIILQSASAESMMLLHNPDKSAPLKMAKYIGLTTNDIIEALIYLDQSDINAVIHASNRLKIQFKPCVEADFGIFEPFLSKYWIKRKGPKIKNMPVLIGFNKDESTTVQIDYNQTSITAHFKKTFDFNEDQLDELVELTSHFYFGDEGISEDTKRSAINFISDFTYIHPTHRTIQKYFETGAGNIYFYIFSYVSSKNAIIMVNNTKKPSIKSRCCASNGDELNYLFSNENDQMYSDDDIIIMKRMTTMWTNFAKYSDPVPETQDLLPVKWKPITRDSIPCLEINKKIILRKRLMHNRMAFWDLFYLDNAKYKKTKYII